MNEQNSLSKYILAGNWKMNLDAESSTLWMREWKIMVDSLGGLHQIKKLLFAPSLFIKDLIKQSYGISEIGIQNIYHQEKGAFTGEVSIPMIKSIGCEHVLIGHSERRQMFGDTPLLVRKKVKACVQAMCRVTLCVGESEKERTSNIHFETVIKQLESALKGISFQEMHGITIAYEPIWAIGTGKTPDPKEVNEMHEVIFGLITQRYGLAVAEKTSILYGGSLSKNNAHALFQEEYIHGGLIGGSSLKPKDFGAIGMALADCKNL